MDKCVEMDSGSGCERLSKLAFLSEGGGKTRVIAIGDYWSQQVLKPLHKGIMNMLRKLPTDGTYDQGAQANRIKSRAGNEAESIDLSSATDRFPRALQKILLEVLISEEYAWHWENLMTNRDFEYQNRRVRYARGQPMGLYSSWAVFALTHHVLIAFAASRKGINSFLKYAVLGDDVVI